VVWIGIDVGLAVIGLLVLAALSFRLWRQVRQLGRDVSAAGGRIADASEKLSSAGPTRH
jgi:hypothetical protein